MKEIANEKYEVNYRFLCCQLTIHCCKEYNVHLYLRKSSIAYVL